MSTPENESFTLDFFFPPLLKLVNCSLIINVSHFIEYYFDKKILKIIIEILKYHDFESYFDEMN